MAQQPDKERLAETATAAAAAASAAHEHAEEASRLSADVAGLVERDGPDVEENADDVVSEPFHSKPDDRGVSKEEVSADFGAPLGGSDTHSGGYG